MQAVERDIPTRPRTALNALLAGPRPSERDEGVITKWPASTRLLAVSLRDTTARVYLAAPNADAYEPSTLDFTLRLDQIVLTLTELPRVKRVQMWVNGRAWGFDTHDGGLIRTYTRDSAPMVCEGRIWVSAPPRTRCSPWSETR